MSSPLEIVTALRLGVPPEYDLELFSVGRSDLVQRVTADLDRVGEGASVLRYIDADIGQGKTHLLKLLRAQAFRSDFVVCIVELSTTSCPLFNLLEVYRKIIAGLRTGASPMDPALESVLERWLELKRHADPTRLLDTLQRLPALLQAALLAYVKATYDAGTSFERQDLVLRYLGGETLPRPTRTQLELFENIGDATALSVLGAVSTLARDLGYGGICILFDEAEGIVSFGRSSQREAAIQNLVRLVRATERTQGCYFIYAATPSFFDIYADHPDLRPATGADDIIELDPLERADIDELVDRIVDLYEAAYGQSFRASVRASIKRGLDTEYARVSDLTRTTIAILDEQRRAAT